jgi:hypothetical protein
MRVEETVLTISATLAIHYHVVKIFLYESAVDSRDLQSEADAYSFARLHMLYGCLEAIRLSLEAFHSIPLLRVTALPYTTLNLLGHAIVVLSKLSSLRTNNWDDAHVKTVLDFSATVDQVIQKISDATQAQQSSDQRVPRIFTMLPGMLRRAQAVHEALNEAQPGPIDHELQASSAVFCDSLMEDAFLDTSAQPFLDIFNEDFWQ